MHSVAVLAQREQGAMADTQYNRLVPLQPWPPILEWMSICQAATGGRHSSRKSR